MSMFIHKPGVTEKKRRHVTVACSNCRRDHAACDRKKPCSRCILKGLVCTEDGFPKKRGPKPKDKKKEAEVLIEPNGSGSVETKSQLSLVLPESLRTEDNTIFNPLAPPSVHYDEVEGREYGSEKEVRNVYTRYLPYPIPSYTFVYNPYVSTYTSTASSNDQAMEVDSVGVNTSQPNTYYSFSLPYQQQQQQQEQQHNMMVEDEPN